jgi:hypothetical protein
MENVLVTKVQRFDDARIGFRNFAGKEGDYNKEGDRNFCIFLDTDRGIELTEAGWNVKYLRPQEEGDLPTPYIQVGVSFKVPPTIVLVTGQGKTKIKESMVEQLDWAEILRVQVVIRPYNWERRGKTGVKAYAKTLYVTVAEDEFESEYYDIPSLSTPEISEDEVPF